MDESVKLSCFHFHLKPQLTSIATVTPNHYYTQGEAAKALGYEDERLQSVFLNSEIEGRYFAVPLETAKDNRSADRNWLYNTYLKEALSLSVRAAVRCLENAKLGVQAIDYLVFATCTGYSVPGLSAYILKALKMRQDTQRLDVYGMGCSAAVPAIHRAHDYVWMSYKRKALVVVTEVYSNTIFHDGDIETAVGDAIFADSSSAVLVGYSDKNGPAIIDFETAVDHENIEALGYTFPDGRFRIRLDPKIPMLVAPLMKRVADNLLKRHELTKDDVKAWIIHPGGKRILEGAIKALELSDEQMRFTRKMYNVYGNTAACGVIFVLDEVMKNGYMKHGDIGLVLTMGPGLTAEGMLLKWQ